MDASVCPHPACGREIPRSMFACRSHWYSLPSALRARIWRAYRSGDLALTLSCYDEAEHIWSAVP